MNRREESAAIWTLHGPADALSTVFAARAVGAGVEANPIVAGLLSVGELPAVVGICVAVAVGAVAWPAAADSLDAPPAAAYALIAVGAAVVGCNMVVAL